MVPLERMGLYTKESDADDKTQGPSRIGVTGVGPTNSTPNIKMRTFRYCPTSALSSSQREEMQINNIGQVECSLSYMTWPFPMFDDIFVSIKINTLTKHCKN